MAEIMSDAHADTIAEHSSDVNHIHASNGAPQRQALHQPRQARERKIKSKYDAELQSIDMADPNNWEIASMNRQRSLYRNLYTELDILGKTGDSSGGNNTDTIFEVKLNKLAPGGNFRTFISQLRKERIAAKNMFLANADIVRVHVPLTSGRESSIGGSGEGTVVGPLAEDGSPTTKELRRAILIKSPKHGSTMVEGAGSGGAESTTMGGQGYISSAASFSDDSVNESEGDDDSLGGHDLTVGLKPDLATPLLPQMSGHDAGGQSATLPIRKTATSPPRSITQSSSSNQKRVQGEVSVDAVSRRLSCAGTYASKSREIAGSGPAAALKPSEIIASSKKRGSMMITSASSPGLLPSALLAKAASAGTATGAGMSRVSRSTRTEVIHFPKNGSSGNPGTGSGSGSGARQSSRQSVNRGSPSAVGGVNSPPRGGTLLSQSEQQHSFLPPIQHQGPRPDVAIIRPILLERRHRSVGGSGARDDGAEMGVLATPNQDKFLKIVEAAVSKFEDAVKNVDKFSKISRRESRRTLHAAVAAAGPQENVGAGGGIVGIDSKIMQQIANEHSTSALMLQNQRSLDGILEVTLKQKAAEKNWVRKVSMAMDDGFIASDSNAPIVSLSKFPHLYEESLSTRKGAMSKKKSDVKVLATKSFGPYPVDELVKFLRAFDSLPQKTVRLQGKDTVDTNLPLDPHSGGDMSGLLATMKADMLAPISEHHAEHEDEHDENSEGGDDEEGDGGDGEHSRAENSEDDWGDLDDILAAPAVHPEAAVRATMIAKAGGDAAHLAHLMKSLKYHHNTQAEIEQEMVTTMSLVNKKLSPKSTKGLSGKGSSGKHRSGKGGGGNASSMSKKLRLLQEASTGGIAMSSSSGKSHNSAGTQGSSAAGAPVAAAGAAEALTVDTAHGHAHTHSTTNSSAVIGGTPLSGVPKSPSQFSVVSFQQSPTKSVNTLHSQLSFVDDEDEDGQIVTKVQLSKLVKHKYFNRVPEWLYALEKLLSRKLQLAAIAANPADPASLAAKAKALPTSVSKPTEPDDWVGLHEIVVDMCPHMNPLERSECLRFLTLKSQNDHAAQIEHKKKEAETARQKALAARFSNMNSIFSFFDKQNCGKVQKFDILKVLKKTLANKAKDRDKDLSGELSLHRFGHAVMSGAEDEALVRLIARLDDGVDKGFSFNEFVDVFETVFGYG
jgi:hypothetical protein